MTTPKFVRLTNKISNQAIWINANNVTFVTSYDEGTTVGYTGSHYASTVAESVGEVMEKINGGGEVMTTTTDKRPIFERHHDADYPSHVTVYDDGSLKVDGFWDHGNLETMLAAEVARLHEMLHGEQVEK
jgi:predicted Rdx family selenoprotein